MIDSGWQPQGDGSNWHHTDGCYVQKDHPTRFSLYDNEAQLLAAAPTLGAAYAAHARIHGHLRQAAEPAKRKGRR